MDQTTDKPTTKPKTRQARVLFTLSMPGNNAWDGKWSGEGRNYTITSTLSAKELETIQLGGPPLSEKTTLSFGYNFGDGWYANVNVRLLKKGERPAKSDGFCGYDWMVDSIRRYGKILTDPPHLQLQEPAALDTP